MAQCVRAVQPELDKEANTRMEMDRALRNLVTRSVTELRSSITAELHAERDNEVSRQHATVENALKTMSGLEAKVKESSQCCLDKARQIEDAMHRLESSVQDTTRKETQKCVDLVNGACREIEHEIARRREAKGSEDVRELLRKLEEEAQEQLESQRIIATALEQTTCRLDKCQEQIHDARRDWKWELHDVQEKANRLQTKLTEEIGNAVLTVKSEKEMREKSDEQTVSIVNALRSQVRAQITKGDSEVDRLEKSVESKTTHLRTTFQNKIDALVTHVTEMIVEQKAEMGAHQRRLEDQMTRQHTSNVDEFGAVKEAVLSRLSHLDVVLDSQHKGRDKELREDVTEALRATSALKANLEEFKDEQKLMWGFLESDIKVRHVEMMREVHSINCQLDR